jgi:hypothetical protein
VRVTIINGDSASCGLTMVPLAHVVGAGVGLGLGLSRWDDAQADPSRNLR